MAFPFYSVELQRGRERNRSPMKTTLNKKVKMNCIRPIHGKEFLCHCLSGSALHGAAMQSCVLLAGTSLLTNPILPQRTPDRHKEKILGWADIPSHGLWMQSLYHTPKPTPLPSNLLLDLPLAEPSQKPDNKETQASTPEKAAS